MTTKNKITYKNSDIERLKFYINEYLLDIQGKYFAKFIIDILSNIETNWTKEENVITTLKINIQSITNKIEYERDDYDHDHEILEKLYLKKSKLENDLINEHNKTNNIVFSCIDFKYLPEKFTAKLMMIMNEMCLIHYPNQKDLDRLEKLKNIMINDNKE